MEGTYLCGSVCVKPRVHFFESWNEVKGKAQGSESLASSRFFLDIFVVFLCFAHVHRRVLMLGSGNAHVIIRGQLEMSCFSLVGSGS